MQKDLSISMLLDFYKQLLTDKQTDAMDLYYNQDLSLAEIAEHLGITRQGVRDNIKRGEKQLLEYEAELGLAGKFAKIMDRCTNMGACVEKLYELSLPDNANEQISKIAFNIEQIENLM